MSKNKSIDLRDLPRAAEHAAKEESVILDVQDHDFFTAGPEEFWSTNLTLARRFPSYRQALEALRTEVDPENILSGRVVAMDLGEAEILAAAWKRGAA